MTNYKRLVGMLVAVLTGSGCLYAQTPLSLEEIFSIAESNSVRLRQSFSVEKEAEKDISVARAGRLPEVSASLSTSFIGDGFTTKRNFKDYHKAQIPHLGTGLSLTVDQPVWTGGAITAAIEMARLKSTASRFATELDRDNLRFSLAGNYLDLYKCSNLRSVVESNITSAKKVLEEMRARYEQGTALHNDITRYELLVSTFELQLIKLENTLDILNNNIVVTAGLPKTTRILPDSLLLSRALPHVGE